MRFVFVLLVSLLSSAVRAQSLDTALFRPNVLRWNITPFLVSGPDSWVLGYERVIKKNQSISLNIGTMSLPFNVSKSDSAFIDFKEGRNRGFSMTADYRFYLGDRNKHSAPNGVYLAPYLGYHYFDMGANYGINTNSGVQEIGLDLFINVINLGGQIGYQFNFNDRWTIDLIMFGPSLSMYQLNMQAKGELSDEVTESEAYQKVVEVLSRIYPGAEEFFDTGAVSRKGNNTAWGPGFRYVVQFGFRF
jgi:hypothetical protein